MSILSVISDASLELGLGPLASVVTASTNMLAQELLAHLNRTGQSLRSDYDWPALTREYTFTLVSGTASYAMPADFHRFAFNTHWNRDTLWELTGPMTESEWQYLKSSGINSTYPYQRWRFKDVTTKQFYLDPTPGASENGNTCVFEYYSRNWVRPKTWVTATAFSAGTYCFYNGNYYSTSAGGTTGATPPTHTSGSASDGAVTWAYLTVPYERITADTDICNIDEALMTLGVMYRYRQSKNLPGWDMMKSEFDTEARKLSSANRGAGNINLNSGYMMNDFWYPSTPDQGFG